MSIAGIIASVDAEMIYRHILRLEGPKNPIDTPERLNEAADYILSELKEYGLEAKEQTFRVEGFDAPFRNIEGATGEPSGPELLIVSHYDTVRDCPGADDNASGVAVMLEAARVLSRQEGVRNIRFVSFTLEENNPALLLKRRRVAQSLGLVDEHQRYVSMHANDMMKKIDDMWSEGWDLGKDIDTIFSEAYERLGPELNEGERECVQRLGELYKGISAVSSPGKTGLVGSNFWVEQAVRNKRQLLGTVCLDAVGYISKKDHSQTLPRGMDASMFETHNVKSIFVGDFLACIGDAKSGRLVESFCNQCRTEAISLPYACLLVPFSYEEIAQRMSNLIRSDHAPFWRAGIPALFLTDSAEYRNPYYHTQADTIEKLDFDFLAKICKAISGMAIDLPST